MSTTTRPKTKEGQEYKNRYKDERLRGKFEQKLFPNTKAKPGIRQILTDPSCPGLILTIQPKPETEGLEAGRQFSFNIDRRIGDVKVRGRAAIGHHIKDAKKGDHPENPITGFDGSVRSAIETAEKFRSWMRNGTNPIDELKRLELKHAEAELRRKNTKTFLEWRDDWLDDVVKRGKLSPSTAKTYKHHLKHVEKPWQTKDIRKVTQPEIEQLIRDIHEKMNKGKPDHLKNPTTANRVIIALSSFYTWLMRKHPGIIDNHPVRQIEKIGARHYDPEIEGQEPPETARDRFLSKKEVKAIWNAAAEMDDVWGRWIAMCFLTGMRSKQLTEVRWGDLYSPKAEIDPKTRKVRNADAMRAKPDKEGNFKEVLLYDPNKGRPLLRPLGPQGIAILNTLKPKPGNPYIFPSNRKEDAHITPGNREKKRIREASKTENWTPHDIRRTINTMMRDDIEAPGDWGRVLLGHSLGNDVNTSVYTRMRETQDKAVALWEQHLMEIVSA